ncbi:MAG TPA: DUF3147 family protein [Terriglobales bacterium]|nr:DUF3147 family protein [Terriglobales bacterium]
MKIEINPSALTETKWYEYAVRFLFGGLITSIAGIIAKEYGPVIGGLFLAFPAIFPASATLIEKHEKEKKEQAGLQGPRRSAEAVSADAAGAAIGSIGLALFGIVVWKFIPYHSAWLVLGSASIAWLMVSFVLWWILKSR